jgi:hypothetical protein
MSDIQKQEIEKWIRTWHNASLSLKNIKINELRSYDYYEKNLKVLDEMLQYAFDRCRTRPSSGLVEQQRIFMKLREAAEIRGKMIE